MVKKMIVVYKKWLEENDWFGDVIKEKVVIKLNNLGI